MALYSIYRLNDNKLLMNYLVENFNVNQMSYNLIELLLESVRNSHGGFSTMTIDDISYKVEFYIQEFVKKLNYCSIDVTIKELIENGILEV